MKFAQFWHMRVCECPHFRAGSSAPEEDFKFGCKCYWQWLYRIRGKFGNKIGEKVLKEWVEAVLAGFHVYKNRVGRHKQNFRDSKQKRAFLALKTIFVGHSFGIKGDIWCPCKTEQTRAASRKQHIKRRNGIRHQVRQIQKIFFEKLLRTVDIFLMSHNRKTLSINLISGAHFSPSLPLSFSLPWQKPTRGYCACFPKTKHFIKWSISKWNPSSSHTPRPPGTTPARSRRPTKYWTKFWTG